MDDNTGQRLAAARTSSGRARPASRCSCTSPATTCASRRPSCRRSRTTAADRAARALLPRARRPGVRHLERGQPRQPAHLPQPDARRRLLQRDVPRGQGRTAALARSSRSTSSTRRGVERYMRSFYRHLSATYRRARQLVGIHNYGDVNRQRTTFTRQHDPPGAPLQPPHEVLVHRDRRDREVRRARSRARRARREPAAARMFYLAQALPASGVERLYIYNWTGAGCGARFDAGLTNPDGTPRPATRTCAALPNYLR